MLFQSLTSQVSINVLFQSLALGFALSVLYYVSRYLRNQGWKSALVSRQQPEWSHQMMAK